MKEGMNNSGEEGEEKGEVEVEVEMNRPWDR